MAGQTLPTSLEVQKWFVREIIPKRTASAGFSGNRLWKGPLSLVRGNFEDPNGLCGDAAAFVIDAFFNAFGDYRTSDGARIAMVLWEGAILNHIANVLIADKRTAPETYRYDGRSRTAKGSLAQQQYSTSELMRLPVLDLYYKQADALKQWWEARDSLGGSIKLSLYSDM